MKDFLSIAKISEEIGTVAAIREDGCEIDLFIQFIKKYLSSFQDEC